MTQILRLHQVVCGFVKHDQGEEVEIKNNRLDALIDVLAETQGKKLLFGLTINTTLKRNIKNVTRICRNRSGGYLLRRNT